MTYKSVDKEKIKIIMICVLEHVKKNNQKCYGIEHATSPNQVGQYGRVFHFQYIIYFFVNLISSISLVP